jgi:thiamine-phosphate pyrophosphorylase
VRIIAITDWTLGDALPPRLEAVLSLGPQIAVQHRHPGAEGRLLLDGAKRLAELCARRGNPLFINRRLDVALLCEAHLHLPADAATAVELRRWLPHRMISVAVHSAEEAARATGADLALVSPVFAPGSKPGDSRPPLGPEGFFRLARALPCPAFALGGVTPHTVAGLNGASGVAAISGLLRAEDPLRAAAAMLEALSSR